MQNFWKLLFGSAGVTVVRTLCSFLVNKVLAVLLGPTSFAIVGQFQNLMAIGQGTSSLALQNGWVSLTAKHKDNREQLVGIWRAGFRLSVFAMVFTSVFAVVFMFIAPLETLFPGIPERLAQAAILFALPGIAASNLTLACSSVMNGLGRYRRWAIISLGASITQTAWVIILLYTQTLSLLSVIATQSILSVAIALPVARGAGFRISELKNAAAYKFEQRKPWLKFAAMGLMPMLLTPLALTLVRSLMASHYNWTAAGLWQGVYRISDFFSVAVSSALGVVLLPKVSANLGKKNFNRNFYPLLVKIMGLTAVCVALCIALRGYIVTIFLSDAFASAERMMLWQLVGDFFRAGGWCSALVLIARQEMAKFLVAETFFQIFFVVCSFVLINSIGLLAPSVAYAVENCLYFVTTLVLVNTIKWND